MLWKNLENRDRELTEPVVPELVLILHPFVLELMVESLNVTPATTLLLFPPTEPIERPCPPIHVMPLTVMLLPDVTATQSSWLETHESLRIVFVQELKSKPSELCAAGSPSDAEFAAY
jgi:hypothetical protein